ncbi:unnamed protein product [Coregonus sp. 'balchen']|nr:unnamed protein product [Coregonus sp. 'balchen']
MVLGKVKTLAVCFDYLNDNNVPVYSGGDSVSGRVIIEVTGEVRVKTLNITARGVAKVRWTESRNAGANTAYTQNYTEEVEYLNHSDTLIGEERDEDSPEEALTVLNTGLHEFAFSFLLPQMPLATSFEGKHGSVRYWVRAELYRPWLLPFKVKKEFTVFEHIDINTPLLLVRTVEYTHRYTHTHKYTNTHACTHISHTHMLTVFVTFLCIGPSSWH